MNKMIFQEIDKELVYYGVYYTPVELWDGKDIICLARKRYFETGSRQKKRSTVKTESGVLNYSYNMEDGMPLRYKKTRGSQPLERSVENGAGYDIEQLDAARRPGKRSHFDRHHRWLGTDHLSPDKSVVCSITPVMVGERSALSVKDPSGERVLYPFALSFDKELTTRLNIAAGEPDIFCVTNAGSFYFCTEEDAAKRREALQQLLHEAEQSDSADRKSTERHIEPAFMISPQQTDRNTGLDLKNSKAVYIDEAPSAEKDAAFFSKLESIAKEHTEPDLKTEQKPEKIQSEQPADNTKAPDAKAEQPADSTNAPDAKAEQSADSTNAKESKDEQPPEEAQEAADQGGIPGLQIEKGDLLTAREPECAFAGECPYETVDKQIIESGGRRYFYFGELDGSKRSGRGRTVMKTGATAYEGEYQDDKRNGFGVYYYKTGKLCYTGSWKENKREGLGVAFSSADGSVFVGQWKEDISVNVGATFDRTGSLLYAGGIQNGKQHGAGITYNENDKTFFVGKYRDGVFLKTGTQFSAEGELLYTGGYQDNCRCGEGISYRSDGSVCYRGEWKNNRYHGEGTLYLENGGTISGTFRNGKANGQATLTDRNGRIIYFGSFADDNYNGTGRLFSEDGGYAEGRFVDGEPTGVFNEYTADKKLVYCGEWTDMHRNGRGIAYHNGEKCYEGEFSDSLYHGEGKLYENGSAVYIGTFVAGKRQGFGIAYQNNEMCYKGLWKNDAYSGCGILYTANEARFVGEFENGKLHGRVNEIASRKVIRKSIYEKGERVYTCEFSPDGSLAYYGNMNGDLRSGMGCSFIASAEKQFEGIFRSNEPEKPMKVVLRELSELPRCKELENTEYELYRITPEYVIEKTIDTAGATGLYSGRLKNGKPDGNGTILFSDHRYTGSFVDGKPSGEGIVYGNSGEEYRGIFSTEPLPDCRTLLLSEITYYYTELH